MYIYDDHEEHMMDLRWWGRQIVFYNVLENTFFDVQTLLYRPLTFWLLLDLGDISSDVMKMFEKYFGLDQMVSGINLKSTINVKSTICQMYFEKRIAIWALLTFQCRNAEQLDTLHHSKLF